MCTSSKGFVKTVPLSLISTMHKLVYMYLIMLFLCYDFCSVSTPNSILRVFISKATFLDRRNSNNHGGESHDFKTTMADTIEKPFDSGKTFFDISVNTGQICMGFDADTLEKMTATWPLYATFKDLVKKLLKRNQKI